MYDSGGIALKPGDVSHAQMKNDMSGAGAILSAFTALGPLGATTAVTGYLMCTDNMPSGTATALGDVITMRGGKTVEVQNTDAEGRLVMADALVLSTEEPHDAVVDIATLTGACMRALGTQVAGVMGNHQGVIDQLDGGRRRDRRVVVAAPARAALPTRARLARRRPQEHRRRQRRGDHGRAVPRGVRRRAALGPPRHRRHRPGRRRRAAGRPPAAPASALACWCSSCSTSRPREHRRERRRSGARRADAAPVPEPATGRSFVQRMLDGIESVGNKVPHPAIIFLGLCGLVIVLSVVLSLFNVHVTVRRRGGTARRRRVPGHDRIGRFEPRPVLDTTDASIQDDYATPDLAVRQETTVDPQPARRRRHPLHLLLVRQQLRRLQRRCRRLRGDDRRRRGRGGRA